MALRATSKNGLNPSAAFGVKLLRRCPERIFGLGQMRRRVGTRDVLVGGQNACRMIRVYEGEDHHVDRSGIDAGEVRHAAERNVVLRQEAHFQGTLPTLPALYSGFTAFRLKAPELKAMSVDRLFDRVAGKIVRRSVLGPDSTNLSPGTKLVGQLAPRHISGERSQTGVCI
jgi:hypothetical protein